MDNYYLDDFLILIFSEDFLGKIKEVKPKSCSKFWIFLESVKQPVGHRGFQGQDTKILKKG